MQSPVTVYGSARITHTYITYTILGTDDALQRQFVTSQTVVTPISTILRAMTRDGEPIYGGKKVTQSLWIVATASGSPALWSHGHR